MSGKMQHVISNFLWRFAERCGYQIVMFFVAIVLARILAPEDYGTIALITVFVTIMQVFVDSGLGTALIQKKNADDTDFSSVFYFNFTACLTLYLLMFLAAPFIAEFYNNQNLTPVIRVLSLKLVVAGLKNIQQAFVSRNMLFKRFFFATLGGTLCSAVIGVSLAYLGYGVWALVFQQLSNELIGTLILWLTVKWRPKLLFCWERLKSLLSFGWKLLMSSLLETTYNNLCNLIIGKMYSPADLAFYNQGQLFPNVIVSNINASIDSVLLPTMSKVQDDYNRIREMTRRAIKTSTYIMAPLMMGLAFCAEPIVKLVLTDKWLFCVPYLRIFCITYMFYPIHTANLNAIKAMGRSDLFLNLEIMKKVVGLVLLFSTMWYGVMAMAYSLLVGTVASMMINSWPNQQLLKYSFKEQIKDIFPSILLAIAMGFCTYFIGLIDLPTGVLVCIQVILGLVLYISISAVLNIDSYRYLKESIKSVLDRFL